MVHKTRIYNWYESPRLSSSRITSNKNRYICLVAAGCMVLMGYDASVFNSVQNSDHWHAYFDNPVCPSVFPERSSLTRTTGQLHAWLDEHGVHRWWYHYRVVLRRPFGKERKNSNPLFEIQIDLCQADYAGRRWAMGIGCFITIIATFMQCFPPRSSAVPVFMAGRVLIGCGQALAIGRCPACPAKCNS